MQHNKIYHRTKKIYLKLNIYVFVGPKRRGPKGGIRFISTRIRPRKWRKRRMGLQGKLIRFIGNLCSLMML